jgi:hypothetical protein
LERIARLADGLRNSDGMFASKPSLRSAEEAGPCGARNALMAMPRHSFRRSVSRKGGSPLAAKAVPNAAYLMLQTSLRRQCGEANEERAVIQTIYDAAARAPLDNSLHESTTSRTAAYLKLASFIHWCMVVSVIGTEPLLTVACKSSVAGL